MVEFWSDFCGTNPNMVRGLVAASTGSDKTDARQRSGSCHGNIFANNFPDKSKRWPEGRSICQYSNQALQIQNGLPFTRVASLIYLTLVSIHCAVRIYIIKMLFYLLTVSGVTKLDTKYASV